MRGIVALCTLRDSHMVHGVLPRSGSFPCAEISIFSSISQHRLIHTRGQLVSATPPDECVAERCQTAAARSPCKSKRQALPCPTATVWCHVVDSKANMPGTSLLLRRGTRLQLCFLWCSSGWLITCSGPAAGEMRADKASANVPVLSFDRPADLGCWTVAVCKW